MNLQFYKFCIVVSFIFYFLFLALCICRLKDLTYLITESGNNNQWKTPYAVTTMRW